MFIIRDFEPDDTEAIYKLFYETVHNININDYSEEQINVWAPKITDLKSWRDSLTENQSFVAIDNATNKIVGFADLTNEGYFNRAYVHKDFIRCGIGRALILAGENRAKELGLNELHCDVSITAKPFMERLGYEVEKQSSRTKSNVEFKIFVMRKLLI